MLPGARCRRRRRRRRLDDDDDDDDDDKAISSGDADAIAHHSPKTPQWRTTRRRNVTTSKNRVSSTVELRKTRPLSLGLFVLATTLGGATRPYRYGSYNSVDGSSRRPPKSSPPQRRAEAPRMEYRASTRFDPREYSYEVWPRPGNTSSSFGLFDCQPPCYNPGMALLPSRVRAALLERFGVQGAYASIFRRDPGSCARLCTAEHLTAHLEFAERTQRATYLHHRKPLVLILDSKLRVTADVTFDEERSEESWLHFLRIARDPKLEELNDSELLVHFSGGTPKHTVSHQGVSRGRYTFCRLQFDVSSKTGIMRDAEAAFQMDEAPRTTVVLKAILTRLDHPLFNGQSPVLVGSVQNLGILWNRSWQTPIKIVHWLRLTLDVRELVPSSERSPLEKRPPSLEDGYLQLTYDRNNHSAPDAAVPAGVPTGVPNRLQHLRNNFSPLWLGDVCPGLYLALGHAHLDAHLPSHRGRSAPPGTTAFGNTYLQRFLVFNATPPFDVLSLSPGFCLPAVGRTAGRDTTDEDSSLFSDDEEDAIKASSTCEVIQFVSSVVPAFEPGASTHGSPARKSVVFTYGINDCEAAHLTVPLADVLAFTLTPTMLADRCPDVADVLLEKTLRRSQQHNRPPSGAAPNSFAAAWQQQTASTMMTKPPDDDASLLYSFSSLSSDGEADPGEDDTSTASLSEPSLLEDVDATNHHWDRSAGPPEWASDLGPMDAPELMRH